MNLVEKCFLYKYKRMLIIPNKHPSYTLTKSMNFKLGTDKVKEKSDYDHVGVKDCLFGNYNVHY